MFRYILKRLLLLPLTLFCIVLVNFVIINLAPGEPVSISQVGVAGAVQSQRFAATSSTDERYLQFREFFGLTLPILFNNFPYITKDELLAQLKMLVSKKEPSTGQDLEAKKYSTLKVLVGDESRYVLPDLIEIMQDTALPLEVRRVARSLFIRGATRFAHLGVRLSAQEKAENEIISKDNLFLDNLRSQLHEGQLDSAQITEIAHWYEERKKDLRADPSTLEKIKIFFFETRFSRYLGRVLFLDFGVLRQNPSRSVIAEVCSRLKISLTLAVLPMIATFFLCLGFGLFMAIWKNSLFDIGTSLIFLICYATPVFVIGPFLIEKIALHHNYPFTDIPFPIRGFSSQESVYTTLTSFGRFADIARHITLPLLTVFYGSLAVQSRLSRAIFLDTLHQDFVRTAIAKGVGPFSLYVFHVGRNAAIPILTSIAGSLGVILGGSVIIETIFEIHGFGKFFYDAIIDRDYNVMMFSALMGSFLSLAGYLVADITYMLLDPRITLETKTA